MEQKNDIILTTIFDDYPKITQVDINKYPDTFEWWYFDFEFTNQIKLVVVLKHRETITSDIRPSLHCEFKQGETQYNVIEQFEIPEFQFQENSDGTASIELAQNKMKLHKGKDDRISKIELDISIGNLKGNFVITPLQYGFKTSESGAYLFKKDDNDCRCHVCYSVPRGEVEGTLVYNGEEITVEGDSYHDHPWGHEFLLNTHGEWQWGRLYSDELTILFLNVFPTPAFQGEMKFLLICPKDQTEGEILNDYTIESSEFGKVQKLLSVNFPHHCILKNSDKNIILDMEFKENLYNNPNYNRSVFSYSLSINNEDKGKGELFKEYSKYKYSQRNILKFISKKMYSKWFVKK